MYEKVNPAHPDKIADRIAGALVDLAYEKADNPRIAVEVLIGHGECFVTSESSVSIHPSDVLGIVERISGITKYRYIEVSQDAFLADNQKDGFRCGDNGIFRGEVMTEEQFELSKIARRIYDRFRADGKYIMNNNRLIICQSNADDDVLQFAFPEAEINPLGPWRGGLDVDAGATNRKLGSDMGNAVTGGGLHGKDLSKADVSVNIYAHLLAQKKQEPVKFCCAIGDETVDGILYSDMVAAAKKYIDAIGGFEKFAEWGLI